MFINIFIISSYISKTDNNLTSLSNTVTTNLGETNANAHGISNITGLQTALDEKQNYSADIAKFKKGSSTYTDNDTSQTFTDTFCTANSLVTVVITSATAPQGIMASY